MHHPRGRADKHESSDPGAHNARLNLNRLQDDLRSALAESGIRWPNKFEHKYQDVTAELLAII